MAVKEFSVDWLGVGTGTRDDPFIIKDRETLNRLTTDISAHFVMVKDVDAGGSLWEPTSNFTGFLDGRGFTIFNLEVDRSGNSSGHTGLFGALAGSIVKNLNIATGGAHITGSQGNYVAVLAGALIDGACVENVCVSGKIFRPAGFESYGDAAGLIGWMNNDYASTRDGYIRSCISLVDVSAITGTYRTAFIAKYVSISMVEGSVYSSDISGASNETAGRNTVNLSVAALADPANYPSSFDFTGGTWEIVDGLPKVKAQPLPGTVFNTSSQTATVAGVVQIDGTPAQRTVRAFGYVPTAQMIDGNNINLSKSLGHSTSDPATGEYTIDLLAGYGQEIFVVAFDDYGAPFTPEATLAAGNRIHPTTPNGHVWECIGAGTLPVDEPVWVVDTETSQLYGTASMIARPFYRPMVHGPIMPEVTVPEVPAVELPTVIGEASNGGFYAGDIEDGGKWYKLIVADIEADVAGIAWMDPEADSPSAVSDTDGPGNTLSMAGDPRYALGNHCLDYRGGGFDDWYMPARDELMSIYQNMGLDNSPPIDFQNGRAQAFLSGFYFCSTQLSSIKVRSRRFSDGIEGSASKSYTGNRVRPVRRLEFTP